MCVGPPWKETQPASFWAPAIGMDVATNSGAATAVMAAHREIRPPQLKVRSFLQVRMRPRRSTRHCRRPRGAPSVRGGSPCCLRTGALDRGEMDQPGDIPRFEEEHRIDVDVPDPGAEVQMGFRHVGMAMAGASDD